MSPLPMMLTMIMMKMCIAVVPLAMIGAASSVSAAPPDDEPVPSIEWHRSQLPCGVRVIIVHAPQAKRQSTFTFLPVHLANDDDGRAQWSHLLEHMLIRTTDAEGLQAEGVMFNGETTADYLRLETIAEPARWREALDRHARWLHAKSFDAERLEREKGMIAGEERSTAAGGFTGKFAIAAWNQIITHAQPVARVHGDVANADVVDVNAYAASRVRLNESVLIATIGPTPVEDLRAALEASFAEDQRAASDVAPPMAAAENAPPATQPQVPQATWDLPTRHMLWWWTLPDDRPQTIAAATGVSRALNMRIRSRRDFGKHIRQFQPHAAMVTARGTFLVLDACINADANADDLSKVVRECAAALCDRDSPSAKQSIVFAARMAAQELDPAPDFAAMSKNVPEPLRDAVEGLWLLSQLNFEYAWGVPSTDVRPLLMSLDDAAVAEVLNRLRSEPQTLLLEPQPAAQP